MLTRVAAVMLALAVAATPPANARAGSTEPPPSPPRRDPPAERPAPQEPPPTLDPAPAPAPAQEPGPTPVPAPAPATTPTPAPEPPVPDPDPASLRGPVDEPYSPAQMTWGPAVGTAPGLEPASASTVTLRSVETALGVIAGEGAGAGEVALLLGFNRFALGVMISVGGATEHLGAGFHLAGGPRFRVSETVRFDVLADLGLVFFGDDGEESSFVSSRSTSGSEKTLPAAGVRAGFTFTSAASGWYLSLGAAVRHVERTTVAYTTTECPLLAPCTANPHAATYGGTTAGGYLTFGHDLRRR